MNFRRQFLKLSNKPSIFLIKKRYLQRWDIVLLIIAASLVFAAISLVNHERFLTFGWDLGFYDQMAWSFSRLKLPYSTFVDAPALGVRFSPILTIFAPFYWIFSDAKVLIFWQAILVAAAAYPIYLIGKRITGSGNTGLVSAISYLSFIGLQRAVFFDFHPDAILTFFTSWALLFAYENKLKHLLCFSFLMLLHKEWVGLLVAAMGLMFIFERQKRLGIKILLLGILGFAVVLYLAVPIFGGQGSVVFSFGDFGETPHQAATKILSRPDLALKTMIFPLQKLETIFDSFWPFAFLPFLAPATLIPLFAQLAIRFFDVSHQQSWTLLYHYSAPLTPLLAYGAIRGTEKVRSIWGTHLLLATSTLGMFLFHAPVFTIIKPAFYFEHSWIKDNRVVIKRIPPHVAVAAQNNLVPHLSAREKIYPLPTIRDAEYVVVDFHPNQSEYNFHTGTMQETKEQINKLLSNGTFSTVLKKGDAMLLKRNFVD